MKGIILAGGHGSRLAPTTDAVNKHLFPVYDKPMIYYSLSTLMLAGIRQIAIITSPGDQATFQTLLQDGRQWGIQINYLVQNEPAGLVQAFSIGENFIAGEACCLALGDNLFYGQGFADRLRQAAALRYGAQIFAYEVHDPSRYGIVELDPTGQPVRLIEKPTQYISSYAVPGLYFYDASVTQLAARVTPSERGELEITDLNRIYQQAGQLQVDVLSRGTVWMDAGTPESLHDAATMVAGIEKRTGLKISCPEEIAFRNGWISTSQLATLAANRGDSGYGTYLQRLLDHLD